MPAATFTDSALAGGWTQSTLGSALSTAMQNAGYTLVSSQTTSSPYNYVFSYVVNASATKSTAYIKIDIPTPSTSVTLTVSMADNSSFTGSTSTTSNSLTLANQIDFRAINHSEFRAVFLRNGSTTIIGAIGYARPASKPSWWSESSYLYAFMLTPSTYYTRSCYCSPNPFSVSSTTSSYFLMMGAGLGLAMTSAPPGSGRDAIGGAFLLGYSQTFQFGTFSNDFGLFGASGLNVYETFANVTSGVTYTILETSNTSAVIGIRTT